MTTAQGTDALIGLLDLVLDGIGIGISAEADGKIDLMDAALLLRLIPDFSPAFANIGSVPAELAALTPDEAALVSAHVMEKLVISDAHARGIIDASLKVIAATVGLITAIKAPVVAPVAPPAA